MRQWGRLFVLMAAVLPTVMNRLDDTPRAASIAHSHTDGGWKLVLVGKQRRCTHAYTFCRHIWMHGSAHVHTERECVTECVCGAVCLLTCSLDQG